MKVVMDAPPHQWLDAWLKHETRTPPVCAHFAVVDVMEIIKANAEVERHLARLWVETKIGRRFIDRAVDRLGWQAIVSPARPGRKRVRRGDFAEILCAARFEHRGLRVPVHKLRVQITPDQTQPGVDVVAFELDGETDRIAKLHFAESKLRSTRNLSAAVEAHIQLARDAPEGYADVLQFIANQLEATDSELFDPFIDHLTERHAATASEVYHISLTWDANEWDERILTNLVPHAGPLDPLTVHSVRLAELANLVDRVLAHLDDPALLMSTSGTSS